jgi:hypothetical protein
MAVFSATVATTAASLIHAYYILRVGGLEEVLAAIVEVCLFFAVSVSCSGRLTA